MIYDYHRHGAGLLVPRGRGLCLGGGGGLSVVDHGLADLPAAAPPPPEAGAAAQREAGHGAVLPTAHRGHGLGEVSPQRVECGEGSLLVLVRQLPAKSRSSGPVSSDTASSCSMLL